MDQGVSRCSSRASEDRTNKPMLKSLAINTMLRIIIYGCADSNIATQRSSSFAQRLDLLVRKNFSHSKVQTDCISLGLATWNNGKFLRNGGP